MFSLLGDNGACDLSRGRARVTRRIFPASSRDKLAVSEWVFFLQLWENVPRIRSRSRRNRELNEGRVPNFLFATRGFVVPEDVNLEEIRFALYARLNINGASREEYNDSTGPETSARRFPREA